MAHKLEPLLSPTSIAIIGASDNPGRIGGMPIDLLVQFGYAGDIYPVNPKYESVFGLRCHDRVEDLPYGIDLAVLAIAAEDVTAMLERCHARGIRAAIVYAAGFAEAGETGSEWDGPFRHGGLVARGRRERRTDHDASVLFPVLHVHRLAAPEDLAFGGTGIKTEIALDEIFGKRFVHAREFMDDTHHTGAQDERGLRGMNAPDEARVVCGLVFVLLTGVQVVGEHLHPMTDDGERERALGRK